MGQRLGVEGRGHAVGYDRAEDGPPELQLHDVRAAIRLSDGRIAVANAGTGEIRIFDPSGRHLSTLGREGDGPGEFRGLDALWAASGDSLIAFDGARKRITVFDPNGRVAATHPLPDVPTDDPSSTQLAGRFASGELLVKAVPHVTPATAPGMHRAAAAYARARPGGPPSAIGTFFDSETWIVRQGAGTAGYAIPFGRAARTAVGGGAFYFGDAESYEIRRHEPDGRLEMVIRRRHEPVAVTDADLSDYRSRLLEGMAGEPKMRLERVLDAVPRPKSKPAFGRMLVDRDGALWVLETSASPDDPPQWSVFDQEGAWRGTVSLPPRFRPYEIGGDYLLGVWYAPETNTEHVQLLPIRKPGR